MNWKRISNEPSILGLPPCSRCKSQDAYVISENPEHGNLGEYYVSPQDDAAKFRFKMFTSLAYCSNCYKSAKEAKGWYFIARDPLTGDYHHADEMLQTLRDRSPEVREEGHRQEEIRKWKQLNRATE